MTAVHIYCSVCYVDCVVCCLCVESHKHLFFCFAFAVIRSTACCQMTKQRTNMLTCCFARCCLEVSSITFIFLLYFPILLLLIKPLYLLCSLRSTVLSFYICSLCWGFSYLTLCLIVFIISACFTAYFAKLPHNHCWEQNRLQVSITS